MIVERWKKQSQLVGDWNDSELAGSELVLRAPREVGKSISVGDIRMSYKLQVSCIAYAKYLKKSERATGLDKLLVIPSLFFLRYIRFVEKYESKHPALCHAPIRFGYLCFNFFDPFPRWSIPIRKIGDLRKMKVRESSSGRLNSDLSFDIHENDSETRQTARQSGKEAS